ncbi:MAG TPA: histidinol-phosphate transaminase, partial [Rhodospirillaceae bacterium]|nr:histidinol-phosphate transaminase [Rhodospirillaceae bacterium]
MSAPIARPGIMDIEAYVGGTAKLPGVDHVIKLSSNEGALGPSPRAV